MEKLNLEKALNVLYKVGKMHQGIVVEISGVSIAPLEQKEVRQTRHEQ